MFDNIGSKIKTLAVVLFVVECIGVFIYAVVTWSLTEEPISGFLVLAIGGVFAWVSVFFIYGFGELIERVSNIDDKLPGRGTANPYAQQYGSYGQQTQQQTQWQGYNANNQNSQW